MIAAVADTHATIWLLAGDPRLSSPARELIFKAASDRRKIALSSISLVEVVYLVEKNRLPISACEELQSALADPDHLLPEAPLNTDIVAALRRLSREEILDMPDRIVAATALNFSVPLITRDRRIRASTLQTIW